MSPVPTSPPSLRPTAPARAIQGVFLGGRPHVRIPLRSGTAQASPGGAGHAFEVPQDLLRAHGRGKPLPDGVRQKMESALGADFSDVRIHVGPEAGTIGALAFTHGSDIYFAPGLYDPGSPHGQRLLGHELTHVVQQRAGRVRNPFGNGVAVVQDPGLEAEAERLGMMAALQAFMPPARGPAAGAPAAGGSVRAPGAPAGAFGASQPKPAPAAIGQARPAPGGGQAAGRALAPHVQAAVGGPSAARTGPSPGGASAQARGAAAGRPSAPSPAPGAAGGPGYRLILGSYLHQQKGDRLPEDLAGHTFVAIQEPSGRRRAWGFSPAGYSRFDPSRDFGRLSAGVEGRVHDDAGAFGHPGVRTRSFEISSDQAQAALSKVAEYRSRHYPFSATRRACSSFAFDVARAAHVDPFPGATVKKPRDLHRQL